MNFLKKALVLLTAVVSLSSSATAGDKDLKPSPPNVVLIMADGLGYYDLSCYGHPEIKTPVLDNLAKEGIKLNSFYSGNTVCTPSRMALLTGAYPTRLSWTKGVVGYKISNRHGLSPQAKSLINKFKTWKASFPIQR